MKESSKIDKRIVLAHIAMFFVAFFYASNYTIAKPVMEGDGITPYVTPFGFIMLRITAATILFWFAQLFVQSETIDRGDWGRFLACAVCGVAANQLSFFHGLKMTTPINGALIMLTTPIMVLIISSIVFKERLTAFKLTGISLGLVGAFFLIYSNKEAIQSASNPALGNIFVAINATFYAGYLVMVKPLMTKYSPVNVLKWLFLIGFFIALPFGATDALAIDWQTLPTPIIWSIGYVLFFVTFMTFILNGLALKVVKPSVNSTYIYLQPLLTTGIAIAVGADQLSWQLFVAGGLIFAGLYLVAKQKNVSPDNTGETISK